MMCALPPAEQGTRKEMVKMARGYWRIPDTACFDCGFGKRPGEETVDLRKFDLPPMCQPCAEKRGYKWEEGTQTETARKRALGLVKPRTRKLGRHGRREGQGEGR